MNERVENEFLDQAISAFLSGSYHVRNAALTAIRRFMQHSEENAFQVAAGRRHGRFLFGDRTAALQSGKGRGSVMIKR